MLRVVHATYTRITRKIVRQRLALKKNISQVAVNSLILLLSCLVLSYSERDDNSEILVDDK